MRLLEIRCLNADLSAFLRLLLLIEYCLDYFLILYFTQSYTNIFYPITNTLQL